MNEEGTILLWLFSTPVFILNKWLCTNGVFFSFFFSLHVHNYHECLKIRLNEIIWEFVMLGSFNFLIDHLIQQVLSNFRWKNKKKIVIKIISTEKIYRVHQYPTMLWVGIQPDKCFNIFFLFLTIKRWSLSSYSVLKSLSFAIANYLFYINKLFLFSSWRQFKPMRLLRSL